MINWSLCCIFVSNFNILYYSDNRFADSFGGTPKISTVGANLKEFADSFVAFLFSVFVEIIKKRTNCSTRLSCQLAVTEFSPEGTCNLICICPRLKILIHYWIHCSEFVVGRQSGYNSEKSSQFWFHFQSRVQVLFAFLSNVKDWKYNFYLIYYSHETYQYSSSQFFSDDSFDEILALTARQDALMAYYFLDEKNQVESVLYPNDYSSLLHFLPSGPCP